MFRKIVGKTLVLGVHFILDSAIGRKNT